MCEKSFSIYGVHIPRKCMYFYSCPSPPLKIHHPGRIFWKFVSPKTKRVEETMIYFIKIKSENMKMTWVISFFIFFAWFLIFLNVVVLQFCEYLSNSVVISLLPLLCNRGNLTLKYIRKNSCLNKRLRFIGRFKVGSIPRTINKDKFIYKAT